MTDSTAYLGSAVIFEQHNLKQIRILVGKRRSRSILCPGNPIQKHLFGRGRWVEDGHMQRKWGIDAYAALCDLCFGCFRLYRIIFFSFAHPS